MNSYKINSEKKKTEIGVVCDSQAVTLTHTETVAAAVNSNYCFCGYLLYGN